MVSMTPQPSDISADKTVNHETRSSIVSTSTKVVLDESDGCFREVNAFEPWFANKQLAAFTNRYPLTGTKSSDVPRTRISQRSKKKVLSQELSGVGPAQYQLKLERLLLEKKERKLDTANARKVVLYQHPGLADEIEIRAEMQKLTTVWAVQRRERNEEYDLRQAQVRLEKEMQKRREQLNTLRARKELEEEQKFRAEAARRQHVEDMASLKEDIARKEANIRELEKAIAQCALESHVTRTDEELPPLVSIQGIRLAANNASEPDRTRRLMKQDARHIAINQHSIKDSLEKNENHRHALENEKPVDNISQKQTPSTYPTPYRGQPPATTSLQNAAVGSTQTIAPQPGAGGGPQKKWIRKRMKD